MATYSYRYFGGLRFLLASVVMFHHYAFELAPEGSFLRSVRLELGSVAVLVFFVLSGYVISEAVDKIYFHRPIAFMANRALRIIPHFAVAVMVSIVLHKIFLMTGGTNPWRAYLNFSLGNAFSILNIASNLVGFVPFADRTASHNFLAIAWTIRIEMEFYLVVFLALLAVEVMELKCDSGPLLTYSFLPFTPLFIYHLVERVSNISTFPPFIPYFWFGSSLYFLESEIRIAPYMVLGAALMISSDYLLHVFASPSAVFEPATWANVIVLIILLMITVALASKRLFLPRGLDRLLGNLSYPLYLYHMDALLALRILTGGANGWPTLFLAIALCLGASTTFYLTIDPVMAKFRDLVRGARL
jgi:peptidoglycan/LPS O-acetylase OafA/YrhL